MKDKLVGISGRAEMPFQSEENTAWQQVEVVLVA
jgi:hypothetical protein